MTITVAVTLSTAVPAQAATPTQTYTATIAQYPVVFTSALQPGDKVRVDARYTTNDLREEKENEYLILEQNFPYGQKVLTRYETYSFDFTIGTDVVSGAIGSLTGYIQDGDADETGELTVTINPNDPANKPPGIRQTLLSSARQYSEAGDRYSENARVCRVASPIRIDCAFLSATAALYHATARIYEKLAHDPADPNYTVIAQPVLPPVLAGDAGIDPNVAAAWNALLDNMRQSYAVGNAILTSLNRASGALWAGDTYWKTQQVNAALAYLLQLSDLAAMQPALHKNLQQAIQQAGIAPLALTLADITDYQNSVYYQGLPDFLVTLLVQIGLDQADIAAITQWSYVKARDSMVAAGGYPNSLTDPTFTAAIQAAAQATTDFALANGTPLARGQEVEGEGFIMAGGAKVDFKFDTEIEGKRGSSIIDGKLRLKDRASGFAIASNTVTQVVLVGDLAAIDGTYRANDGTAGTFRAMVTDKARKGKPNGTNADRFAISLSNGYHVSGPLGGGTIKIERKD